VSPARERFILMLDPWLMMSYLSRVARLEKISLGSFYGFDIPSFEIQWNL
jgi:hypothetical protein